jgi:phage portal protein BeeE
VLDDVAMSWLTRIAQIFGLRLRATAPALPPSSEAITSRLVHGRLLARRDQAEMLRAYEEYPHLHTVVRGRAEAIGAVEWVVLRARSGPARRHPAVRARSHEAHAAAVTAGLARAAAEDGANYGLEELQDSPLLDLLERPCRTMSGPAFWELASTYEDLVGEALWIMSSWRGKRPTELVPVPPPWLQDYALGEDAKVTLQMPYGRETLDPEVVIWHRMLSPADPFWSRGFGTAMVLRDELQTDELMSRMARSRFANRGWPDLLLGLLGHAGAPGPRPGQTEVDRMTMQMEMKHTGAERAGQAHVIAGDFKAQTLGHSLVDNQYMDGRRFGRDTVMQTFRRPPELAGVLDNANRSTISLAEDLEARQSTTPKLERFRALLQDRVAPLFGSDLIVSYRSVVPADRDYQASIKKALPGAFRLNEIRRAGGELPLPGAEGDTLYKAPGAVPVKGAEGQTVMAQTADEETPTPPAKETA